jgi:hypothetical protein
MDTTLTLKDNMDTTSAMSPIIIALIAHIAEALNAEATPSYDANARFFGIDHEVEEGELVHLLPSWGDLTEEETLTALKTLQLHGVKATYTPTIYKSRLRNGELRKVSSRPAQITILKP